MTFKHVKFEDSPTMRALEKIAKEKGLVKPEPLKKNAASRKTDLTPALTLMENIFKLSEGLREKGMQKEAAELEMHYFNCKRAQTLYETSKEKGEDVVHDAHPDGSHKLENVEGDEATVEDILDRHVKMLAVVNKGKPSGRLTTSAEVMRAVKMVFAQDATTKLSTETYNELKRQTDELDDKINSWALLPGSGTTDETEMATASLLSYIRSTLLANKVTEDAINKTIGLIDAVLKSIGRTFWTKETNVAKMCNGMKDYLNNYVKPEHAELVARNRLASRISNLRGKLSTATANLPQRYKSPGLEQGQGIISGYQTSLDSLEETIKGTSTDQLAGLTPRVDALEGQITSFITNWKLV